jgi:hypothetical protein
MDKVGTTRSQSLVPVASLQEFFRDSVDAAMASNHIVVDSDVAHYVVNLLTLFARSEYLYEQTDSGCSRKPLALMLADAVQAGTAGDRNLALQRLGDVSLFTAGFQAEALQQKSVGIEYYVNMGGGAYRTLSLKIRSSVRGEALAAIFTELAARFQDLVDVLNEVRDSARGSRDQDILRLYETWLGTGSRRAGRLLRQAGVEPNAQFHMRYSH